MNEELNNIEEEPVYYCNDCLSLNIRNEEGIDMCFNCGSVDIGKTDFEDWEYLYKKKYKRFFIEHKNNY